MIKFFICNELNRTFYVKYFIDYEEARHWVINHLDLSLNWNCKAIAA
jgi:hypothetical protein